MRLAARKVDGMRNNLSAYLRPRPRHFFALSLLVSLMFAAAAFLAWQAFQTALHTGELQKRADELQSAQARAQLPKPSLKDESEHKQWMEFRLERDFAWSRLFQALEQTANANIELLEFRPDKRNRSVILIGEARDRKALTAFLAALSAQSALGNVHLLHQQTVVRDRLETISFEVKASLQN